LKTGNNTAKKYAHFLFRYDGDKSIEFINKMYGQNSAFAKKIMIDFSIKLKLILRAKFE